MAKTEMMDVLQYLEQRHAIKSKQFHEVKKVGLFGRRVFSKSLGNLLLLCELRYKRRLTNTVNR